MASKTVTDLDRQLYLTANKCAVRLLNKQIMETLTIEWAKANSMAANWHFKWVTKWVRFQSSHSARSNSIFCATQNYLGAHLGSGFGEMVGGGGAAEPPARGRRRRRWDGHLHLPFTLSSQEGFCPKLRE